MRLEPFVEIECDDSGVRDRDKQEDDGKHRESRQRMSSRVVLGLFLPVIHSEELEAEVRERPKINELGGKSQPDRLKSGWCSQDLQ